LEGVQYTVNDFLVRLLLQQFYQGSIPLNPTTSQEGKMAFFQWIGRQLWALIAWAFRSIGDLIAEFFREVGRGIGRLIARFLPWTIGAAVIIGMIKFMPEVVAPLVGIIFCFVALWVMVRGILPGKRKK
jgi:hypothetical protein